MTPDEVEIKRARALACNPDLIYASLFRADAAFINHARADVLALCDALRQAQDEVEQAELVKAEIVRLLGLEMASDMLPIIERLSEELKGAHDRLDDYGIPRTSEEAADLTHALQWRILKLRESSGVVWQRRPRHDPLRPPPR